jgi:hypothetical protein
MYRVLATIIICNAQASYLLEESGANCIHPRSSITSTQAMLAADRYDNGRAREDELRRQDDEAARQRAKAQAERNAAARETHDADLPCNANKFSKNL